jgi:proline iminopeptidase
MASGEGQLLTDDGVRLYFRTLGSGARTLVIPNGMCMLEAFEYLAQTRTLIVYDVRNRGQSETVTDPAKLARGVEQDVDDVDAVRRHHGLDRIDLLGHSYIGLMVALYAMRYAAHVNRVVQIGPAPADALKQYPPNLSNNDAILAEVFARVAQLQKEPRPADPEAACRRFWDVLKHIYVTDSRNADRIDWGRCHLENERNLMPYWTGSILPSIRGLALRPSDFAKACVPVLTIHGTKDRSAPYGGGRDWAAMLPQARLLTVHNASHAPWIESPTEVFDAVKVFLDGRWPADAQASTRV